MAEGEKRGGREAVRGGGASAENHYNSRRETTMCEKTTEDTPIPADDLQRTLTLARPDVARDTSDREGSDRDGSDRDASRSLPHIGLVGDTYTITVSGQDTAGRF